MKKTLVFLTLFLISIQVQAAVISGGIILPDGTILLEDGLKNKKQQAFNEAQGVLLTTDLAINGGVISAGTKVDSHIVFYNTPGRNKLTDTKTWTFDGTILGLMIDSGGLQMTASNYLFANGVYFTDVPGGSGFLDQGLEPNDSFTISGMQLIDLVMTVREPGDWIRVITASTVPVPAAIWLFGFALFGLMGIRRQSAE